MRSQVACWALVALLTSTISAAAAPVQWSGNGHYYDVVSVPAGISWTQANAAANAAGGYLATVTSGPENAFVFGLVDDARFWNQEPGGSDLGPWLGGYQTSDNGSTPNANWRWVTTEPWSYTNWYSGEPNNFTGALENYLSFKCSSASGCRSNAWNDLPDAISQFGTSVIAYVIESDQPLSVGDGPGREAGVFMAAPNPLRAGTTLQFTLGQAGAVRLTVLDAQGRRVRELVRDAMRSGPHQVSWDGRDQRGRALRPGSYFARLDAAGVQRTIGLSVVR